MEITIVFSEGGIGVNHGEEVTIGDMIEALGALSCVVASNLYRSGGSLEIEEWIVDWRNAIDAYLEDLEAGRVEAQGTSVKTLPAREKSDAN